MSTKSRPGNSSGISVYLPVTPMLDMTFQLLFFFVSTFNYTPVEGQIPMKLPSEPSGSSKSPPEVSLTSEKDPVKIVVYVEDGDLKNFDIESSAFSKKLIADVKGLLKELDQFAAKNKVKLTVEVPDSLSYAKLISLLDALKKAGFEDIGVSSTRKAKT